MIAERIIALEGFSIELDTNISKPGWIGIKQGEWLQRTYTKQNLLDSGLMTHFAWDGR